jgi:hypothetical protein
MPEVITSENAELLGMFGMIMLGFLLQPAIGPWSAIFIFGSMAIIPVTELTTQLHFASMDLLEATVANYEKGKVQLWLRKDFRPVQLRPLPGISETLKRELGLRATESEPELHRVSLGIEPITYKDYGKIDQVNITFWGRWEDRVKFRPRMVYSRGARWMHGNVEYPILWELETQHVEEGIRIPEFFLYTTANGDKGKSINQYELLQVMDGDGDMQVGGTVSAGVPDNVRRLITTLQNQLAYYEAEVSRLREENIAVKTTQGNWASITQGLMRRNKLGMDGVRQVFAGALADHDAIRSAFRSVSPGSKIPYFLLAFAGIVALTIVGLYGNPQLALSLGAWLHQNEAFILILALVAAIVFIYVGRRKF